jgi:hypothetical protein
MISIHELGYIGSGKAKILGNFRTDFASAQTARFGTEADFWNFEML